MMYSLHDLTREIEDVIEGMEGQRLSRLHPDWITQAVMNLHTDIAGNDTDFYAVVSRQAVREAVRKRLNKYKAKADSQNDDQLVLEGFERLQKRYLVKEDGEYVAILVFDMTSSQRLAKAQELRALGDGCYQHADELERYDAEVAA